MINYRFCFQQTKCICVYWSTNKVSFRLQATLTITSPLKKVFEGSDIQFLCSTKANPPQVSYRWFVNDQYAPTETSAELWLMNITRKYHNSRVRCEVENSVGRTEDTTILNILCKYTPCTRSRVYSFSSVRRRRFICNRFL